MFTHYYLLGVVLEHLGKELQKDDSELRSHFILSFNQARCLCQIIKICTSPSVQVLYVGDLCERFGKDRKTISHWIDIGLMPKGKHRENDTRLFWFASEVDEAEEQLMKMGYINKNRKRWRCLRMLRRARMYLCFKECGKEEV